MWTMTEPKSTRTQCEAAVPSRPIGLRPLVAEAADDAVGDGLELALRAAGADHEVVGHGRQAGQVEQHDVGGLLVLGQLDDPPGELERRSLRRAGAALGAVGQAVGAGRARGRRQSRRGWRVRSRSWGPHVVGGTAHGRRCRPRPHPGRGSAAIGRPPRGARSSLADRRRRGPSRNAPGRRGRAGACARKSGSGVRIAVARRDDDPCQLQDPPRLAPGHAGPGTPRPRRSGRGPPAPPRRGPPHGTRQRVDRVRRPRPVQLDPARPRSRSLPAIASSTIASRSLAGRDRATRLVRRHAGRDERTRSRPRTSARLLGDREMRDVDGIERPAEDAAAAQDAVTVRSQGCASHSSSVPPIRTVSPAATPARRSSVSMPKRARSRWNRSADSSTSKLVWAAIRSIRAPRTRKTPVLRRARR